MLRITPAAGLAINRLADDQETTGLRLEAKSAESGISVAAAAYRDPTDVVVTEETTGAQVVLDELTADYVADKTLDVDDTVESVARFRLAAHGM
jgi:Fe-S cluster assembly iron-binding protein IscA